MIYIFVSVLVLGGIIAVMEQDGFPGWIPMIISVAATIVPAIIINLLLPPGAFIVGLLVGAVAGGCAISALCGMSLKRACIAASIFLVFQIVFTLALTALLG